MREAGATEEGWGAMSNDRSCPRCGELVSEKSLEAGTHECAEYGLLDRIESLEERVAALEPCWYSVTQTGPGDLDVLVLGGRVVANSWHPRFVGDEWDVWCEELLAKGYVVSEEA